jgi:hypothetical protein
MGAVSAPISRSQAVPPVEKVFEGQLIRVDAVLKIITIRGTEDKEIKEMSFHYSDATEIVNADKSTQGLSGMSGTSVRIRYRVDRGSNEATKIETAEQRS